MPRGVRRSVSEQISNIDKQIAELQSKRKELESIQEQEAVQIFLEAAKAAGKSPIELVNLLTQNNPT